MRVTAHDWQDAKVGKLCIFCDTRYPEPHGYPVLCRPCFELLDEPPRYIRIASNPPCVNTNAAAS